jgi:Zn-finger nucleic acid-binding protein
MELLPTRGYFFCRYCGSFHFPEGVADQGIRILGESPRPMECAACQAPLAAAMLAEQHAVQYCRKCRGVLTARATFADVVQMRRAWATNPPAAPVPLNQRELERRVTCPSCRAAMATHPYYGPGNVVIDTCAACDLVWLDFGELAQIVNAPGRDRGQRGVGTTPTSDDRITAGSAISTGGAETVDLFDLLVGLFDLF